MTDYNWIDNPTESGVAICDPDILNECLMHLKYDNQKITKIPLCFNSGNTNSNGNSDLFETEEPSKIILNVPGNYTINIPQSGYYPVILVGGGGNGQGPSINYMGLYSYCGGGSGAAFVGEVYLTNGSHNITIGGSGGNSSIDSLIVAGGSTNAAMSNYNMQRAGGYGGILTISSSAQTQNVTIQKNGNNGGFSNNGTSQSGGASVYNGFGKGADSSNNGRTNGYFSIIIPSFTNNLVYKVGGNYKALTGTLANGQQFTLNGINSDNVSSLSDGNYVKYIGSDGSSELLNTSLIVSKTQPTATNNKVWINNGTNPLTIKKYVAPNYTASNPAVIVDGTLNQSLGAGYIQTPNLGLRQDKTFKIEYKLTKFASASAGGYPMGFYTNALIAVFMNDGGLVPELKVNDNGTITNINMGTISTAPLNEPCTFTLEYDGIDTYTFKRIAQGGSTETLSVTTQYPLAYDSLYFGRMESQCLSFYLPDIKVWVDDELVYTPNVLNNGWVDYDKIPLGKITVSSGAVTGAECYPYNIDYISNNIVKSYKNGNIGYIVHADGYCVQWGRVNGANGGTVTLPLSYADTNYNIQLTARRSDATQNISAFNIGDRTTSSFVCKGTTTYTAGIDWVTTGYIHYI